MQLSTMPLRIVLFDDNSVFRDSIRVLLDGHPDLEVSGAFGTAAEAVDIVESFRPDVVLMDIEMPDGNGIDAVKRIRARFPQQVILMLTVFGDDDKVFESICSGASGYLLKNTAPEEIVEGIRQVRQGGAPMSPGIARKVLRLLQQHAPVVHDGPNPYGLSDRESTILGLLVEGLSYKMIAAECNITYETVRSHMKNIYEKLHVASMTEAVGKAIREGLV
jgi:DNA-binding NarL/FixJ family response regulator